MIDKSLTLQMIILGLKTNEKDKVREVTGKEVADNIGVFTNSILPPYDLSQYANGK